MSEMLQLVLIYSLIGTSVGFQARRVVSNYSIPGEYFALDVPVEDNIPRSKSCFDYGRGLEEPLSSRYKPRSNLLSLISDGVPRSAWRWQGHITPFNFKQGYERVRCRTCMIVHYRIQGGRLYLAKGSEERIPPHRLTHQRVWHEMLSIMLYLFPMPDMDFLLHSGDGCTTDLPLLSPNICRDHPNAGFTLPSFSVWSRSMGPRQMTAYHSCLRDRYPGTNRTPIAIWRGSTTNTRGKINKDTYMQAVRVRLHLFARNYSDVLDAKIVHFTEQADEYVRSLITDIGSRIPSEDYNRYCVILDIDGNGWSDRFGNTLINYPTPILKLASNRTGFFEHLYAPGDAIMHFDPDLSNLVKQAKDIVNDCTTNGESSRGQKLANKMQITTRALMDHIGLVEGFAYSLLAYKNLTAWFFNPSLENFTEVNMSCCSFTRVPPNFAELVTNRLTNPRPKIWSRG